MINQDSSAPVVAVNLWYDVGSRHEQPGRTGLAHLFEHLMFEGSRNVAKSEHFRLVNEAGGTLNATTWCDRTTYFETVPSNQLELMLWLEADRMAQLAVTQETLDNQRAVVSNERRQTYDNQPYGSWLERIHAAVYPPGHPYHHPAIGSMADLQAASLPDVQAFYRAYYAPDNAVLSLVGDVDPAEGMRAVRRYFDELAPRSDSRPVVPEGTIEALIGVESREQVAEDVPTPRVFLAYRAAPFGSVEYDATRLLAAVLGAGRGSRLYRRLVLERNLAQPADEQLVGTWGFVAGASVAFVDLLARDAVPPEALLEGYDEVLAELVTGGLTESELARARAMVLAGWLAKVGSLDGRADAFGCYTTLFGTPCLVNDLPARLAAVGPEDVRTVAEGRLRRDNRHVLVFQPGAA